MGKVGRGAALQEKGAGDSASQHSHSSKCYVYSPLSSMGTRERKQYCPEGKVCASNLTSHVRTLPGVDKAGVLLAFLVRSGAGG